MLATLGALVGGCGAGSPAPKPVPTLGSSPQSSAAFQAIREAWRNTRNTEEVTPAVLRALLEGFLARYPDDGLAPLAHVYVALVALKQQDFAAADRQLAWGVRLPPGTTRDTWTVAAARRARLKGQSEAALELLRPLVGRSVDPIERALFEEELTLSALATHRDYEAISYMDAWLRASSEEERDETAKTVGAYVERLPDDVVLGALQGMRARRTSFGYGVQIERILAGRLVAIATTTGDAELARLLLDSDAGPITLEGDAGLALGELAMSRRGLNVVDGRTIGLLLPTESPGLRDESADALRGIMWALGLPKGVRSPSPMPTLTSSQAATPAVPHPARPIAPPRHIGSGAYAPGVPTGGCAPIEPAPALEEPRPEQGVRLVTRDDAGSADRTEVSLDELAGEGAAVIIAGLDEQTAARALRWGAEHRVAVIALVAPSPEADRAAFGFVLGEPRANVLEALTRAVPLLARSTVARVVDASEAPGFAAQGTARLALTPPVSCDIPATSAGDARFPIAQWEHAKTAAWIVSGSPTCATDLVTELSTARVRGAVALTLEAAVLPAHAPGLRVVSASAGVVPDVAASDSRDGELKRFTAALGRVTWWTALGRDASTLARLAVAELPTDLETNPAAVLQRRVLARDRLAASRARLWTTEGTGWSDAQTMPRTVCAMEAPVEVSSP